MHQIQEKRVYKIVKVSGTNGGFYETRKVDNVNEEGIVWQGKGRKYRGLKGIISLLAQNINCDCYLIDEQVVEDLREYPNRLKVIRAERDKRRLLKRGYR